ncbi:NAD(P)/FAD-dependent oxidoreductase [Streptomyces sp. NPDC053560]|uniref:NAD(P)/FAD-dependent oxidoreductase n=1 Tax=Streptomyces sp. NPDC053560 TaxID=3365711 RepID=UPI0037CD76F7
MTSAVVLGGGMAGMLAAAALARSADRVTVIESDRFPDGPAPRKGLPQGHHNHMLMSGGAQALDDLLPGTTDALFAAGARRRGMPGDLLTLSAEGWYRRHRGDAYVIACSRELTDHVVRTRVLADKKITVIESAKATGPAGDRRRITGVRIERAGAEAETIEADLVVDATGRRSRTPEWLTGLGLPDVQEERVDAGFAYASRLYEAPEGTPEEFPGVLIQARSGTGSPGRGAALLPNEGNRWIVALIGTRGGRPPTDEAGFEAFARELRDPVIADLMAAATPAGPIRAYRGMPNWRRRYEKLPLPDGLVVIGDAATTLNPNYATGMSIAALGALALRTEAGRHGIAPGLGRAAQQAIAKAAEGPWQMAVGADQWFPGAELTIKRAPELMRRFTARFARMTTENAALSNASFNVAALQAPPSSMMTLSALLTVARGPRRAPLTREQAIAQYPEFGDLLKPAPADAA